MPETPQSRKLKISGCLSCPPSAPHCYILSQYDHTTFFFLVLKVLVSYLPPIPLQRHIFSTLFVLEGTKIPALLYSYNLLLRTHHDLSSDQTSQSATRFSEDTHNAAFKPHRCNWLPASRAFSSLQCSGSGSERAYLASRYIQRSCLTHYHPPCVCRSGCMPARSAAPKLFPNGQCPVRVAFMLGVTAEDPQKHKYRCVCVCVCADLTHAVTDSVVLCALTFEHVIILQPFHTQENLKPFR